MSKSKKKNPNSGIGVCPYCGEPANLDASSHNDKEKYTVLHFICPNGHKFPNTIFDK